MERLTDKYWRNFDPWECCGQDEFCIRGCHDQGGCTNGCIVPKLYCRLASYEDAEQDGRLVVLPCAIGSEVFTIEGSYFDCENCEHGAKARYDPKINLRCCEMDDGEHCPYHIEGHIVEGFTISVDDAGKPSISAPGEWGYEGLEKFSGIDGKWYPTREEAEAALVGKGGGNADKDA